MQFQLQRLINFTLKHESLTGNLCHARLYYGYLVQIVISNLLLSIKHIQAEDSTCHVVTRSVQAAIIMFSELLFFIYLSTYCALKREFELCKMFCC